MLPHPNSATYRLNASPSSMGSSDLRCMFSTRDSSKASLSSALTMLHDAELIPSLVSAANLRSPAITS